jgi:hypothetical protein
MEVDQANAGCLTQRLAKQKVRLSGRTSAPFTAQHSLLLRLVSLSTLRAIACDSDMPRVYFLVRHKLRHFRRALAEHGTPPQMMRAQQSSSISRNSYSGQCRCGLKPKLRCNRPTNVLHNRNTREKRLLAPASRTDAKYWSSNELGH